MNILFFLTPKSEVDYIEESASVLGTVRKMKECNYSEIPVISKNGKYVGTINSGDILGYLFEQRDLTLESSDSIGLTGIQRVRDNKAVNINCQIEDMVDKILQQNFVPVVDDEDNFIGIITRRSVVKFLHDDYVKNNSNETGDK